VQSGSRARRAPAAPGRTRGSPGPRSRRAASRGTGCPPQLSATEAVKPPSGWIASGHVAKIATPVKGRDHEERLESCGLVDDSGVKARKGPWQGPCTIIAKVEHVATVPSAADQPRAALNARPMSRLPARRPYDCVAWPSPSSVLACRAPLEASESSLACPGCGATYASRSRRARCSSTRRASNRLRQRRYFDAEFAGYGTYSLDNWRLSFIERIFGALEIDDGRGPYLDVGVGGSGATVIEAARRGVDAASAATCPSRACSPPRASRAGKESTAARSGRSARPSGCRFPTRRSAARAPSRARAPRRRGCPGGLELARVLARWGLSGSPSRTLSVHAPSGLAALLVGTTGASGTKRHYDEERLVRSAAEAGLEHARTSYSAHAVKIVQFARHRDSSAVCASTDRAPGGGSSVSTRPRRVAATARCTSARSFGDPRSDRGIVPDPMQAPELPARKAAAPLAGLPDGSPSDFAGSPRRARSRAPHSDPETAAPTSTTSRVSAYLGSQCLRRRRGDSSPSSQLISLPLASVQDLARPARFAQLSSVGAIGALLPARRASPRCSDWAWSRPAWRSFVPIASC
jgi:hypothetical protein